MKASLNRFNWLVLLVSSLIGASASAQVPVALMPVPRLQFADNNGVPLAGGCVSFFNAGTTTPAPTYVDILGVNLTTNPVILDSAGRATIYGANQEYKVQLNAAPGTGTCSSINLGALIWVQDNVSPFQVIVGTQTIIFAGVTVDPTGQAGMMDYRSDIPCFRSFTTVWDCFVRLNDTQTLTNKTLTTPTITSPTISGTISGNPTITAPSITSPTINNVTVPNTPGTYVTVANDPTTGTTLNTLTKLLPSTNPLAVITASTDLGGIIGVTVSGAGKTGNATLQQSGIVNCIFDNSVTNGNYVVNGTGGDCHAQAQYPVATQNIGRVLATGAAGTYPIILFSPDIEVPTGVVAKADLNAQNSNVGSSTLITPAVNGVFRFSCEEVITQAATTSSTLPQCNLNWTDGDSSVALGNNICATSAGNIVGQQCGPGSNANSFFFSAKAGLAITWSTTGYASSGATQMLYAVHVRLEGPF